MATLGKYELLDQLGTGSMGTVYRALDTLLEREVALKTIRVIPSLGSGTTERFHREAKAGAKLQHPSIVTIYELGDCDGSVFIAMELLTGATLRQVISERWGIDAYSKLELIAQTCDGLAHAHRAGIVHRDIKPSNIFRTAANTAKVLDFGIARMPASILTMAGSVLGTPNYMSPEQILGNPCDGRSDLFSAAIVLFELLTGVHPFRGSSIPRRIVNGNEERLRDIDPSLPEALSNLLAKALSLDPSDRFQTGDLMASEIRAVASELPRIDATLLDLAQDPASNPSGFFGSTSNAAPNVPETAGENTEWRISEFLRLLQEFDEALESGKLEPAHQHLQGIRHLGSRDERFTGAVVEYESRLLDLQTHYQDTPPLISPAPPPPLQPVAASNGHDAAPVTVIASPEPEIIANTGNVGIPPASTYLSPASSPAKSRLHRRTEQMLSAAGAIGVIVILVASIYGLILRDRRPVPVLASMGTARVRAGNTSVYAAAMESDPVLQKLLRGDSVNVIASAVAAPDWVKVQPVSGRKASAAGFVKAADLDGWSSMQVLRLIQPAQDSTSAERLAYLEQVQAYLDAHANEADAREARMEIAAQNIALAQAIHKKKGSRLEVQKYSDAAVAMLNQIGADATYSDTVQIDRRALDFLRRNGATAPRDSPGLKAFAPAGDAAAVPPPPAYSVAADLKRATLSWQSGDYTRAKRALKRVLRAEPRNAKAKELLDKIGRAQTVDPGVNQQ